MYRKSIVNYGFFHTENCRRCLFDISVFKTKFDWYTDFNYARKKIENRFSLRRAVRYLQTAQPRPIKAHICINIITTALHYRTLRREIVILNSIQQVATSAKYIMRCKIRVTHRLYNISWLVYTGDMILLRCGFNEKSLESFSGTWIFIGLCNLFRSSTYTPKRGTAIICPENVIRREIITADSRVINVL